jgi:zearalenone synthase (highly reducing iterative type I polyketide synthase)
LLTAPSDAHSETSSRWNSDAFYHPNKNTLNTIPTRGGHFVKGDVYAFDAAFFNIPAAEAFAMDPRQRMTLEVVYEAFESAGMPLEKVKGGQTAVYVGAGTFDYQGVIQNDPEYAPKYTLTGISHEVLANRISHYFDLHGPSMTVETACSSSLVAIHLACQSLRNGEADMAVAGGINLILQPEMTMQLSNLGFLSQFGHCRSFDEAGDGYGRGEGCGFVVLKRLADAERDGDPIRAVVRGSGVNSDGWTQGITLPSATAQAALIRDVYKASGLDMDSTQYVECHGTGTKVGDPIEVQAIHETLGQTATPSRRLIIGSVKPNIGHLEAGAAVSGLIKGVLAMERGMIPPQIYLDTLNTKIPFDEWNIAVPRKLTPWPVVPVKRMSLSSFGMGGTNAHIILEGVDKRKGHPLLTKNKLTNGFIAKERILDKKRLFTFSAFDQAGLERVAKTLADHLDSLGAAAFDPSYLANLAYTLGEGRSRLSWKTTCFAEHGHELREKLDGLKGGSAVRSNTQPRICYVFTGQGAQWAGMGVELLDRKVFGSSVAKSVQYLHEYGCEWDVVEELRRPAEKSRLGQPHISQPICTVLQIALVDELKSWGINPLKCVGHSSGEIGAAYAVGTLSHKHAIAIAYFRGQASSLIKETRPDLEGGMMAVGMSREEAEDWISKVDLGKIGVACVNSPESVTISGDVSGLDQLLPMLEAEKIFARKLKVGVAYHSHHMNEVMSEYLADIADIEVLRPAGEAAQMISSVTGSLVDPEDLGPYYWVRNLVSPVEFADALVELVTPGGSPSKDISPANTVDLIIEVGPHTALGGPIQQILGAAGIKGVSYAAALKRGHDGLGTVLKLAADLFIKGAPLNVRSVNEDDNCKVLVDLPPYPWNHSKTFNVESRMSIDNHARKQPRKSLIGAPMPMTDEDEHVWRGFLSLEDEPWIRDHKLNSMVLFPAAGLLSMVLQAAQQMTDPGKVVRAFKMRDVTFMTAMLMNEDIPTEVILHIRPHIVSTAAFNPHT